MLLHGGIYPVHLVMESFGAFLTGMGYPEAGIRDPGSGDWSYSPYLQTSQLAGLVAWQYEHDGLHPMLVGHSQGGLSAVRILKDLAGWGGDLRVYNPLTATLEARTTIIDPLTGRERPAVGVSVSYASAIGAGGLALVLPGWWESLDTLRKIPDTVDEFTGYFIEIDLIALEHPGQPARPALRKQRQGARPQRNAAGGLQPRRRPGDRVAGRGSRRPGLGQRVRARPERRHVDAPRLGCRPRAVGGRRLVQHQEALGPRSAAMGARAARPRRDGKQAALSGWRRG